MYHSFSCIVPLSPCCMKFPCVLLTTPFCKSLRNCPLLTRHDPQHSCNILPVVLPPVLRHPACRLAGPVKTSCHAGVAAGTRPSPPQRPQASATPGGVTTCLQPHRGLRRGAGGAGRDLDLQGHLLLAHGPQHHLAAGVLGQKRSGPGGQAGAPAAALKRCPAGLLLVWVMKTSGVGDPAVHPGTMMGGSRGAVGSVSGGAGGSLVVAVVAMLTGSMIQPGCMTDRRQVLALPAVQQAAGRPPLRHARP